MSKIALTGNASGTGTLTIAAPSTNTDRTLTLPDEAGTVLTNTSGVAKTGDTMTGALTIQNAGFDSKITLQNTGTGGQTFNLFSTMNSFTQGGGNLMFHTSSAPNGILKMDASGRVTMPYQPSFMAVSATNSQTGVIDFSSTHYNVGNHFDTSTDRFTAPVNGTYFFSWTTTMGTNQSGASIDIRKNGTALSYTNVYTGDNLNATLTYPSATICVIHYLSAGDYVDVNVGTTIQANYGAFVGYLIG